MGDDFHAEHTFVATFDILGFKALRREKGTAALAEYYDNIVYGALQHAKTKYSELTDNTVRFSAFSDTVIIYSKDASTPTFMVVLAAAREILKLGFCGGKAPFRGAIGYGDLSSRKGILIGSAIEDAYLGEQAQVWSGCMLTPALQAFLDQNGHLEQVEKAMRFAVNRRREKGEAYADEENFSQLLLSYSIPIQERKLNEGVRYYRQEGLVLNWTQDVFEGAADKAFPTCEAEHPTYIKQHTVEFERWARAR